MPSANLTEPNPAPKARPVGASALRQRRRRTDRLPDATILVVEDEYLVAADLARQISLDGSTVVGPAPTAAAALELLQTTANVGGAVLDVRLGAETAFPIAEELRRRDIPFVFFTGYDDISWPPRFRSTPKISKTADWRDLKRILFGPQERRKRQSRSFREDVAAALPTLREAAREITGNSTRGDRLVEEVLEIAIANVDQRTQHPSVADWLLALLRSASATPNADFLN